MVFILGLGGRVIAAEPVLPEPGAENDGMRMRLMVRNWGEGDKAGHEVRVDVLNVSPLARKLRADWLYETDTGNLKEYLEAATSIESYPPIAPWVGQIMGGRRTTPQPDYTLEPGEVLTLQWHTEGNFLKNRVSNKLEVQNPEFAFPGMYSVHATLLIQADGKKVSLRSNEQPVFFGKSWQMPKFTFGKLISVDEAMQTARLDLGEEHKVAKGDKFLVRTGMVDFWQITITEVDGRTSAGRLEPRAINAPEFKNAKRKFPAVGLPATLIIPDAIDRLAAKLASSFGTWMNGGAPVLDSPKDAPVEEVVKEVLDKTSFAAGKVKEFKILQQRQVRLEGPHSDIYTAVRVQTDMGEKIVVLQEKGQGIGWWSRVYAVE